MGLPPWTNHLAFDAPDPRRPRGPQAAVDRARATRWCEIDHGWCTSIYAEDPNGNTVEFCCTTGEVRDANAAGHARRPRAAARHAAGAAVLRARGRPRPRPDRGVVRPGATSGAVRASTRQRCTREEAGATVLPHQSRSRSAVPLPVGGLVAPDRRAVDDARLRAFIATEYRKVVATVELVCGSLPTAEDAVQEAMARAVGARRRGEQIDRLPAWITTVALNLARSQMRRWKAERRAPRSHGTARGRARHARRECRGARRARGVARPAPPPARGHRAAVLRRARRRGDRARPRHRARET